MRRSNHAVLTECVAKAPGLDLDRKAIGCCWVGQGKRWAAGQGRSGGQEWSVGQSVGQ